MQCMFNSSESTETTSIRTMQRERDWRAYVDLNILVLEVESLRSNHLGLIMNKSGRHTCSQMSTPRIGTWLVKGSWLEVVTISKALVWGFHACKEGVRLFQEMGWDTQANPNRYPGLQRSWWRNFWRNLQWSRNSWGFVLWALHCWVHHHLGIQETGSSRKEND